MRYESDIITVAVVNFKVETGKKEENVSRILAFSESAAKRGADLILFPEMCVAGYDYYIDESVSMEEKRNISEAMDGPTCTRIAEAAEKNGIYIVAGMAEKDKETGVLYNSAYVAGPAGPVGAYRKIHPFHYENSWCAKGDRPFLFDTKWGPVSVGICYDTYNFPELTRHYASKGSRLYLNPTALVERIHLAESRQGFLGFYVPTIEYPVVCNTIFVANANLVGKDRLHYFGGGSCVLGPKITPTTETDAVHYYAGDVNNVQAGLFLATLDLSLAKRALFTDNPYTGVPDYRPELYARWDTAVV